MAFFPATDELFCSNAFLRLFSQVGETIGIPQEEFAQRVGLGLKSILDPEVIVAKQHIIRAYFTLIEHSNDECFGLGQGRMPRGTFDLMVKVAANEDTLLNAFSSIEQVLFVSQSPLTSKLVVEDDLVRWQFSPQLADTRYYSLLAELSMLIGAKLIELLIKKEVPLSYASFKEDKPLHAGDMQFLFPCERRYGQDIYEIAFNKNLLNKPIRCNYHDVKAYLVNPLSIVTKSYHALGVVQQIKEILAVTPWANFVDQQELAQQLNMSVKTLQRKLEAEDTSYMQLKDDIRKRKALFYLEHTNKNLSEIATRCGFSERASFSRAFQRWTGTTPSKYFGNEN